MPNILKPNQPALGSPLAGPRGVTEGKREEEMEQDAGKKWEMENK